ncbi:MAG: glycosyltransferase [Solirubrobacterales bacterium]
MRLLVLGKAPPIQGGVSAQTFWLARALAEAGHSVEVVTNATEVEPSRAQLHYGDDEARWLDGSLPGLRIHRTTPLRADSFIPFAQPHASKLIGLAHAVLERHSCDAILGWYLEPYGVAAAAVGRATGVPYVLRHAGSDIGRLAEHPDLRVAYGRALEGAAGLIVTNERELEARLGETDRPRISVPRPRLPEVFTDPPEPFDLDGLVAASGDWLRAAGAPPDLDRSHYPPADRAPEPGVPVIGTYGKVGVTKGSFDLLAALARLADEGVPFAFLSLSCGSKDVLRAYYESIRQSPSLLERTWVLPAVGPWRIPGFLRECDAVCFLERDFPIEFHGPLVPREALSSGSCLVCSAEAAAKPAHGGNLVDGRNAVVIADPRDHAALAARLRTVLSDPVQAEAIGGQGRLLARFWDEECPSLGEAALALAAGIGDVVA